MKKYRLIKYILIAACLVLSVSGCSAKKKMKPKNESHEALLEKGLRQMKKGDFMRSLNTLQTVKDRYPYTKSAIVASLKLADTQFELDKFTNALELYEEFERFHPKDENTPYVMYQKGMCYFVQIRSYDREQELIIKASQMFQRLIQKYPDDEYANKAKKNLRKCLAYMAQYEVYVGNFYFKMGKYQSALDRYIYSIKKYPDMGHYHEALENIARCRQKLAELNRTAKAD